MYRSVIALFFCLGLLAGCQQARSAPIADQPAHYLNGVTPMVTAEWMGMDEEMKFLPTSALPVIPANTPFFITVQRPMQELSNWGDESRRRLGEKWNATLLSSAMVEESLGHALHPAKDVGLLALNELPDGHFQVDVKSFGKDDYKEYWIQEVPTTDDKAWRATDYSFTVRFPKGLPARDYAWLDYFSLPIRVR